MKRLLSAMTVVTTLLVVCPAFADSPTTVLNAVQNQGNTSGQAAIGTSGNTNQNNKQNSLGTSSATSVNIGGISITPGTTGGGPLRPQCRRVGDGHGRRVRRLLRIDHLRVPIDHLRQQQREEHQRQPPRPSRSP